MLRQAPDPDVPQNDVLERRREVTKRALIVLGASLLLQPTGGSTAEARRRKHRGSNGGLNCIGDALPPAVVGRCKREAAFRHKLAIANRRQPNPKK